LSSYFLNAIQITNKAFNYNYLQYGSKMFGFVYFSVKQVGEFGRLL